MKKSALLGLAAVLMTAALSVQAAPVKYEFDPAHTYPSFEVDHMGGLSVWRGKFNKTSGFVTIDAAKKTGELEAVIDMTSFNSGHEGFDTHAKSADLLDAAKYPTAVYKGRLTDFEDGKPGKVVGHLTLKGVTKPLNLDIDDFKCMTNPMTKDYTCGADVEGEFNRDAFGVDYAKNFGFNMKTKLKIQVEAIRK